MQSTGRDAHLGTGSRHTCVDYEAVAAQPSTTPTPANQSADALFVSGQPIRPRIPTALLTRTPEYCSAPVDQSLWWHRHRDLPAVFRQATYLWTQEQRAAIERLWPPGWFRSDSRHPLLRSKGTVRPSSSHNASDTPRTREICVRTAVSDAGIVCVGRSYVLCDLSLTSTHNPVVAQWAEPIAHGPQLMQVHNLLQTVAPRANPHADHALLQMLIGTQGSFTAVHSDWYGADAYLQLQQGEKLWYLAPPEHEAAFRRLFQGDHASKTVCVTVASKAHTDDLLRHGVHVVHQKAGDIIFVPGGWLHAVKNLSDTVAFGSNYLRGWKLPTLVRWARVQGASVGSTTMPINLAGIFRLLEQALIDPFAVAADCKLKPKAKIEAMQADAAASTAARRALAMSDNEIAAVHEAWKKCVALRSSMPPKPAGAATAAAAAAVVVKPAIRLTSIRQLINATQCQTAAAEATAPAGSNCNSQPAAKRPRLH